MIRACWFYSINVDINEDYLADVIKILPYLFWREITERKAFLYVMRYLHFRVVETQDRLLS